MTFMLEGKNNKNIINIVILSVVFGTMSGIVGNLVWNAYFEDVYAPITGEINYSNGYYRNPRLDFKDAKTVVVQQNDRVDQAVQAGRASMVGIFRKIKAKEGAFSPDRFYRLGQESADGFVITSDGWIITNFKMENPEEYAVVDSGKNVYGIEAVLADKVSSMYFIKINARELPVRKFAEKNEIHNGQLAIAVDWSGRTILTSITERDDKAGVSVQSSDIHAGRIMTSDSVAGGLVLYNLAGDAVGFIDKGGKIEAVHHFFPVFSSLLSEKKIRRPSFGANYIDLSGLVSVSAKPTGNGAVLYRDEKGVSVLPGGVAASGGFKEGDIILSIDSIILDKDNDLTDVVQRFRAGDLVTVSYLRNGQSAEKEIRLGEVKY